MKSKVLAGLVLVGLALAQSTMTNDSVLKMAKAGLTEDIILGSINGQAGSYRTDADSLIALKSAGVSDKVIGAMIAKGSGSAPAPAGAMAQGPTPTGPGPVSEVGVYYKKNDAWMDLAPEVVNFKTGGMLKTIGTAGIVKGDVNGHITGEHSPNSLHTPIDILVYAPEGTNVSEYQLLKLHEQKDSREFRTVTGGVFHVSGGANRDMLPFESKKIAPRTWEITVPNLTSGDYGLLPPSASDSTRIGKLYSFRIIE